MDSSRSTDHTHQSMATSIGYRLGQQTLVVIVEGFISVLAWLLGMTLVPGLVRKMDGIELCDAYEALESVVLGIKSPTQVFFSPYPRPLEPYQYS